MKTKTDLENTVTMLMNAGYEFTKTTHIEDGAEDGEDCEVSIVIQATGTELLFDIDGKLSWVGHADDN